MKTTPPNLDVCTGPYSETQLKIILAAERLFARSSIDSASLREIALEADQRNHYAVQYHFGSRQGLVRAVFAHRMVQMEERRGQMLAEAERCNRLHLPRTLLDMLYLPQLALQDADGNHSYAKFLCQFLLRQRSTEFGDFDVPAPPNLLRIFRLLRGCLGHLSDAAAQRRLVSGSLVFLSILAHYDGDTAQRQTGDESFAAALEDTLALIERAIMMPLQITAETSPAAAKRQRLHVKG